MVHCPPSFFPITITSLEVCDLCRILLESGLHLPALCALHRVLGMRECRKGRSYLNTIPLDHSAFSAILVLQSSSMEKQRFQAKDLLVLLFCVMIMATTMGGIVLLVLSLFSLSFRSKLASAVPPLPSPARSPRFPPCSPPCFGASFIKNTRSGFR